jgi:hypothetical protein
MWLREIVCCSVAVLIACAEVNGQGRPGSPDPGPGGFSSPAKLAVALDSSNLPLILINTNGQTIPYGTKITATMRVIDHGPGMLNHPTDTDAEYDGYIGIEVRGHFSALFPQKPYGLETRDSLGNNLNVSLLGMPKENDWILISNYNEKSLMRSLIAFDWFRGMGHYATRARLCEVLLNGEYRGIYVFSEKIKPDKNRVNIAKMAPGDITGVAVTGGYVISVDYYDGTDDNWISSYPPVGYPDRKVHYDYVFPKPEDIVPAQKTYIQNFIRDAEGSLYGPKFTDSSLGYRRYVDVPSFIDYFILSEVSRNVDGFKKSRFFYKDRDDGDSLLRAGPVWDFDWAWKDIKEYIFANTDGSGWGYKDNDYDASYAVPDWHKRLLQDGAFTNALIARYQSLRTGLYSLDTFNRYIDSVANAVHDAQQRHFALWPISASNMAPEVEPPSTSYGEEVTRLKDWIARRIAWLDVNIPKLRDNIIQSGDTSDIQIANPSFELPGTEKVKGWDGVCADPAWTGLVYDIPGWQSDVPAFDSGVEQGGYASDGTWSAFLKGSDTSVYQITSHTILAGDHLTMTADLRSTWGATLCAMGLFYLDGHGAKVAIAETQYPVADSMVNHSVSFRATEVPACIGHTLVLSFDNVSPTGDSWVGVDNVRLLGSKTTGVALAQASPLGYSLSQNYPNPFNPATEIEYQLPENSMVSLAIYDILGRKVAVLASGMMPAGHHNVAWNAQNGASGIYFGRLMVTNAFGMQVYAKTIRLVLMK